MPTRRLHIVLVEYKHAYIHTGPNCTKTVVTWTETHAKQRVREYRQRQRDGNRSLSDGICVKIYNWFSKLDFIISIHIRQLIVKLEQRQLFHTRYDTDAKRYGNNCRCKFSGFSFTIIFILYATNHRYTHSYNLIESLIRLLSFSPVLCCFFYFILFLFACKCLYVVCIRIVGPYRFVQLDDIHKSHRKSVQLSKRVRQLCVQQSRDTILYVVVLHFIVYFEYLYLSLLLLLFFFLFNF